jgi:hypothetical protein
MTVLVDNRAVCLKSEQENGGYLHQEMLVQIWVLFRFGKPPFFSFVWFKLRLLIPTSEPASTGPVQHAFQTLFPTDPATSLPSWFSTRGPGKSDPNMKVSRSEVSTQPSSIQKRTGVRFPTKPRSKALIQEDEVGEGAHLAKH